MADESTKIRNSRLKLLAFALSCVLSGTFTAWLLWSAFSSPSPKVFKLRPDREELAYPPGEFDFCVPKDRIQVTDGDTLKILAGGPSKTRKIKTIERIRLIGIDAPEMSQKPYGAQAKASLLAMTDRAIQVCCQRGDEPKDRYGRTLAYCWAGQKLLNAELIAKGEAYAFFIGRKNNRYQDLFESLEAEASRKGLGIHNPEHPLEMMPSSWRKLAHRSR